MEFLRVGLKLATAMLPSMDVEESINNNYIIGILIYVRGDQSVA